MESRFDIPFAEDGEPARGSLEDRLEKDGYVVIMTAFASIEAAVKAMKQSACGTVVKPFDSADLSTTIRELIEHRRLVEETIHLRKELGKRYRLHDLTGRSAKMIEVFDLARTAAAGRFPVLIQGEGGTGKELLARAIHAESPRRDAPFVPVPCAALPESLLEGELFGREKGPFSGADAAGRGKIELAGEGTLFLDGIGDASLRIQADLVRALDQGEFRLAGGSEPIAVGPRVIAASNRDLRQAVAEGRFRDDLLSRLNALTIRIPPLRDRKEDIPLIARHFVSDLDIELGKAVEGIDEEALRLLIDHDWPGNVQELRDVIERAMAATGGRTIRKSDVGLPSPQGRPDNRGKTLDDVKKEHIRLILDENRWNINRSAHALGIDRVTLYNKIRKYELKKRQAEPAGSIP